MEHDAGAGSGLSDEDYERVGARVGDVGAAWGCDLVLKVKEPQPPEFGFLRDDQVLFTYLHLAANPGVADALRRAGTTGVAYETVEDRTGRLPLLAPDERDRGAPGRAGRGALPGAAPGRAGRAAGRRRRGGAGLGGGHRRRASWAPTPRWWRRACRPTSRCWTPTSTGCASWSCCSAGRVTLLHSTQLAIEELLPTADLVVGRGAAARRARAAPGDAARRSA